MANAPKSHTAPAQKQPSAIDAAASAVNGAAKTVAKEAQGFDALRPFRMMHQTLGGGFKGMLTGMSQWGSRGATAGFIGGALFGIANAGAISFIGAVGMGLLGGIGVGIALGGVVGLVAGTAGKAAHAQSKEDAHGRRRHIQQSPTMNRGSFADRVNDSNFERSLQQNQENDSHWRDLVSSQGPGQGRGF